MMWWMIGGLAALWWWNQQLSAAPTSQAAPINPRLAAVIKAFHDYAGVDPRPEDEIPYWVNTRRDVPINLLGPSIRDMIAAQTHGVVRRLSSTDPVVRDPGVDVVLKPGLTIGGDPLYTDPQGLDHRTGITAGGDAVNFNGML